MQARRERLRAQGLRPVQHWVPDLRDPKVLADLRRQAKLMAGPVEGGALDKWTEKAYDWFEWRKNGEISFLPFMPISASRTPQWSFKPTSSMRTPAPFSFVH